MCEMLRKRRAIDAFKKTMENAGKQPSRLELIRLVRIAQYKTVYRMFQRLRSKANRQKKASKSLKLHLQSDGKRASKWKVLAQQCVDKLLVNASFKVKDRAKLALGKQLWKDRIVYKYLGMF